MLAGLSKEDINGLPLFHYTGKTTLVRSEPELADAMQRLLAEKVLGFDTETRPSFSKGTIHSPSLIQLATEHEVFLIHLKWIPLHPELMRLFENPAIIKTGVAAHDDMRFLAKLAPFSPCSVIDLTVAASYNRMEYRGLRGLAAAFLGVRISKGEQCSNWANKELSPRQIRYAATDAWISRALYLRMLHSGISFGQCNIPCVAGL
ncbi:MAG: 3'-5' exonuclease domain-containing protein 2 [Desulfovibrio sp.]|nr:3'-5' exonuclease domain-containing protein 2 [Desulfovibrio sp.]